LKSGAPYWAPSNYFHFSLSLVLPFLQELIKSQRIAKMAGHPEVIRPGRPTSGGAHGAAGHPLSDYPDHGVVGICGDSIRFFFYSGQERRTTW
jgi:hypothetical protein